MGLVSGEWALSPVSFKDGVDGNTDSYKANARFLFAAKEGRGFLCLREKVSKRSVQKS